MITIKEIDPKSIPEDFVYYVYVMLCPTTRKIRYIGKGKKRRAWNIHNRTGKCASWLQSLKNLNTKPIIYILKSKLTEERAFILEKKIIKLCMRLGCDLTNLTEGGDGPSGYKHTPEQIAKMARTWFKEGSVPPNKGTAASAELRERVRVGRKNGKTPVFSDESRVRQLSGVRANSVVSRIPIIGIHSKTGEVIRFDSMMEAARSGFLQPELSHVCKNEFGKYTHKGYYWRKDDIKRRIT